MKLKFNTLFLFILVSFCFLNIPFNVFATNLQEEIKIPQAKKCTKGGGNYVKAESNYHPHIEIPRHFPDEGFVYASVKAGTFDVYVYEIVDGIRHSDPPLEVFSLGGEFVKKRRIRFTLSRVPRDLQIVFVLRKSDDICSVGNNAKPIQNKDGTWTTADGTGYVYFYNLGLPSYRSTIDIANLNYDGICSTLRTGNYDQFSNVFSDVGLSKKDFDLYRTKIDFPYCKRKRVSYNYSLRETALIIRNKVAGKIIDKMYDEQSSLNIAPGATVVTGNTDFSSKGNSLKCPAYQNVNGKIIPNQAYTTKKYYKRNVSSSKNIKIYTTVKGLDGVCKETCEENLSVTYGPPVASKAGLCFEYKVKVESKVNCNSTFTVKEPKPEEYTVCTPVGACNGGDYHSASGPNDEFDSCVKMCDGGKYSQKCIDKCYNKIYDKNLVNNNSKIKSMGYNDYNIKQLPKELLKRYNEIIESGPDAIGVGKKYSYEDLKIALTEAGTGFYYVRNNDIYWNMGKARYWERPGAYYTLGITHYTVSRLQFADRCNSRDFAQYGSQCGISLVDTGSGLLRNNSGSGYCEAICEWFGTGCYDAKHNGYYNGYPKHPGTPTNRSFLNPRDAINVYKNEFTKYEAEAKECKSKAKCSTKTAEYTIKVNNKTNSNPDKDNWIDYFTSIKGGEGYLNPTTVNGKNFGNFTIVLDNDGCYKEGTNDSTKYLTEWSFPGTWINNKTGKISYTLPTINNAWHKKTEKFCTNLDSKDVNTSWWIQRSIYPNENVINQANIDEYNIKASVKDFGYFNWSFNVDCFYSMYDNYDYNENNNNNDNLPNIKGKIDYKVRNVRLDDLFPDNKDEESNKDSNLTGRIPGFNWSSNATNIKNSNYLIAPEPLYQEIQKRGNSIYASNNKNEYLDYEFKLSPKDLNNIRRYSKELDNNYSKFGGRIKVNNGIAYYESNLFRGTNYLDSTSVIYLGKLAVNNQAGNNSNSSEIFTNEYVNSLIENRKDFLDNVKARTK